MFHCFFLKNVIKFVWLNQKLFLITIVDEAQEAGSAILSDFQKKKKTGLMWLMNFKCMRILTVEDFLWQYQNETLYLSIQRRTSQTSILSSVEYSAQNCER